jgi:hypothetical protein
MRRDSLSGMMTSSYRYWGFRFPAEIIQQTVWLYHCFSLGLRDVETILAARGVVVSYESIRDWGLPQSWGCKRQEGILAPFFGREWTRGLDFEVGEDRRRSRGSGCGRHGDQSAR